MLTSSNVGKSFDLGLRSDTTTGPRIPRGVGSDMSSASCPAALA